MDQPVMMKTYNTGWGEVPESRIRQLTEKRDKLEERLNKGYDYLLANPQDPKFMRWEDEWTLLLKEYEDVCDQLASMPQNHTRAA
jgi:hypothetical protein